MVFDPRLALTFAVVAEELSFTRAAERLGVAQPWVSEQVQRLEGRLGFRLLVRTSRRTELTQEGLAFLPHARALARANDAAQQWVRENGTHVQTLRLGAVDFVNEYPERTELISRFIASVPEVRLNIVNGVATELVSRLGQHHLDAVIAFDTSASDRSDILVGSLICQRFAALLIPGEDPLARESELPLSAIAGRMMVTSPGQSDVRAFRATAEALERQGAIPIAAPEARRATIENLARARRAWCFRWTTAVEPRQVLHDMVAVPLAGTPLALNLAVLTTSLGARNPMVARLCEMARRLNEETAGAGPLEGAPASA